MNTFKKSSKFLAFLLAMAMIITMMPISAFASEEIKLQDGAAKITSDMTTEQVKQILFDTLVVNKTGHDAQSIEWEYGCDGYNGALINWSYGSIEGFQSKKLLTYYTHPALKNAKDITYNIRIKGREDFVRFTKSTKNIPITHIVLKDNIGTVNYHFKEDKTIDFDRFRSDLFDAAYDAEKSSPSNLTVKDVNFQMSTSRVDGIDIWESLEANDTTDVKKDLSEGGQFKFRMLLPENEDHYAQTIVFYANVAKANKEVPYTHIAIKENMETVLYHFNENKEIDFNRFRSDLFDAAYDKENSTPNDLTVKDVNFQMSTSRVDGIDIWENLESNDTTDVKKDLSEGGQFKFRMLLPETERYEGATVVFYANVAKANKEVPYTHIVIKENMETVYFHFNENKEIDFDRFRSDLFSAAYDAEKSSPTFLTVDDVNFQMSTSRVDGIDIWENLESNDTTDVKKDLSEGGRFKFRMLLPETERYEGATVVFYANVAKAPKEVPTTNIVLKENIAPVKIQINENNVAEFDQFRQDLFNAVYDAEKSTPNFLTVKDVNFQISTSRVDGIDIWESLEANDTTDVKKDLLEGGKFKFRMLLPETERYNGATVVFYATVQPVAPVLIKQDQEVLLYLNDDLSLNFTKFRADLFDAIYDKENSLVKDLTVEKVNFQMSTSRTNDIDIWESLEANDTSEIKKDLSECGRIKFRILIPENDTFKGSTIVFFANVKNAPRTQAVIELNDNSINYTGDTEAFKKQVLDKVVNWKTSTLPAKDKYNSDYYTIEYWAQNEVLDSPAGTFGWVPLEGATINALYYPPISAGEQQIRVTFKGNSEYTSASNYKTMTINKGKTRVKLNVRSKFADEQLPKDYVTTSSTDKFDIFTVFVGNTTSSTGNLCIDLPDSITDSFLIDLLNPIVKLVTGKSMDDIINKGITLEEITAILNSSSIQNLLKMFNVDISAVTDILNAITSLPGTLKKFKVSFTEPNQAGLYQVIALALNPNYETGIGLGTLKVKMRHQGSRLSFDQQIANGKISAEEAKTFTFNATLTYQGIPVENQNTVHYLYTGFKSNGLPYFSTTTAPRTPGYYTQTAVILGGDYFALPCARSFRITK